MRKHEFIQLIQKRIDAVLDRIGVSKVRPLLVDVVRSERAAEYGWVLRNLDVSKGRVLDVGCGRSRFCVLLATLGFRVSALDMRDNGQRHPNLEILVEDILRPSPKLQGRQFDRVCCISVLEHLAEGDDQKALINMSHLLSNEGKILLSVPYGKRSVLKEGTPWEERVYDRRSIEKLTAGFEVELADYFVERSDGSWQLALKEDAEGVAHQEKCEAIVCLRLVKK